MDWTSHAQRLADEITDSPSRWRNIVAATPRHLLAPSWWEATGDGWRAVVGERDPSAWMAAAYGARRSVVTRVGDWHADLADHGMELTGGRPTSSATMPALTVQMLGHLRLFKEARILDCGTGSGYGAALMSRLVTDENVTSVDIDKAVVDKASDRLAALNLFPYMAAVDATTGGLPEEADDGYDRLLATFSVQAIPAAWLRVLRVGGRFVTTLTGTSAILTAHKTEDGGADGRIARDWASFIPARHGEDYPPTLIDAQLPALRIRDGELVEIGRYPVLKVTEAWELHTMHTLACPGVEHHFEQHGEGIDAVRTAFMTHSDGSWARAVQRGEQQPEIHQGGPQRLWSVLDELRERWLRDGSLPVYGSTVQVDPDGTIHLKRGRWEATLT